MRTFLENDLIKVEADTHGAEVKSVLGKAECREYMWYGNPRYWGRTSPVLFPFVGSLRDGVYLHDGRRWPMGQHGFARDREFQQLPGGEGQLRFRLSSDADTLARFPFPFVLDITYTLNGTALDVLWTVTNPGPDELPFSIGAHPAFLCPIHGEADKTGYRLVFDGCTEIHHHGNARDTGLSLNEDLVLPLKDGCADISGSFFDRCTYIAEGNQCGSIGLIDPQGRQYITVRFDTPLFGIWSPEKKNAPFVCIEPWYGRCDAEDFSGTLRERTFSYLLAAGESFRGGYSIEFT